MGITVLRVMKYLIISGQSSNLLIFQERVVLVSHSINGDSGPSVNAQNSNMKKGLTTYLL